MTVRGLIDEIRREIRDTELAPDRAAELLTKLTALLANVLEEIREADAIYAGVLLRCLESEEAASRAKIRAEITPEYQRKREARDTKEIVTELCRSLKYLLKTHEEQMRLTR